VPTLNEPQAEFLQLGRQFKAFVAGFGSGKTWVGAAGLCRHAWQFPRMRQGYFAPTYPMIRDIFYETIDEVAHDWDLRAHIKESNKEVMLSSGGVYRSTILCRSMDNPGTIVGFKIGHAQVDEIDLMPMLKAEQAWRKIIARLRSPVKGAPNSADVTTTPEGYRFAYKLFAKEVAEKPELAKLYGLVRASTYENEANLPAGYIDSLRTSYPPQLIRAYLEGRFVNLTSGSVYPNFDRHLNHSDAQLQPGEALHIGMDFNVMRMAATLGVVRNGAPIVVGELVNVRDTPTMARIIKERYARDRSISVYPDASGASTSSKSASESDLSILRGAGLRVQVNPSNPAVKDRVNAVNALILNDAGLRRLMVNTREAPVLTEALEQQPYDANGEPDKTTGHDHPNDAIGYWINQTWPVLGRNLQRLRIVGH
jgi:hypothetical protein